MHTRSVWYCRENFDFFLVHQVVLFHGKIMFNTCQLLIIYFITTCLLSLYLCKNSWLGIYYVLRLKKMIIQLIIKK